MGISQNLANFTQVGPVKFPNNPSVQTTGMGRVSQLVYHPKDSNIIFAVTASGGVFKSSNEGNTWKPISDFLPQTSCASLAINPSNPNVMYLGTGDANYNGGGLGVWKTIDGGDNWVQSNTGMGNKLVSYIRFIPNDTSTLLAACSDGIYKSTNSGSSWAKKTSVTASYRDLMFRTNSFKIVYAATNTYFYRSYDGGDTWIQSDVNSNITCAGIKIAICPSDTSKLYCVVWKGGVSPFGGVYKSTNNGTTFTLQVDTPNLLGYSSNGASQDGQGSYNLGIIADPSNANTIYVVGINMWKSTDQGVSFTMKSHWAYGVHADKHGITFSPFNKNKLYINHDGGLDRSLDGGNTWTTLEDGLSASEFYKMGNSVLYNDYIIGGLQDNGMDISIDKKFSTVRGGDWTGDFAFDAFDSSILYENGGLKRNIVSNSTTSINGHAGIYCVNPADSNMMFEATTEVYRTKNLRVSPASNVTWSQLTSFSGLTSPRAMSYSKSSYGTFYVAFNPQTIYRSDNINAASPTFTKITSFTFNTNEQVRGFETCDYDSNIIYMATNQARLFKSKDKGATWENISKNLPNSNIIKFLLNQKAKDSSMYVATAFGVYYRNRNLKNWINFSKGLPTVAQISDMEIMSDGTSKSRLHIAMYGRGIWQTDLYNNSNLAPVADYTIDPSSSQLCANTIILVDNSLYSPTSRQWIITPASGWSYINGTDSSSSRAEIQFTASGMYYISLTVSNASGSNTKTVNYNYSNISVSAQCSTTTTNLGGFTIGIYRFEFNTIDKSSSTGNTSYEDFSCNTNSIVKAGGTYTAWVTNGNSYNENAKIYIDYNNNGVFTDSFELVGTISNGQGRRSCAIALISNPTVYDKFVRMRVVSDYNNVTSSCGTLSYGQSEDYAIYIDKAKPTVAITIPKPTVSNGFVAIFKTSEIVYGFDVNDVVVSNATIANFTQIDGYTYSAKIIPINNAQVKVSINANGFNDLAGNYNSLISDSTTFFLGIKTYTFAGLSVKDTITQNTIGGSITSYLPYATIIDSLIATFTLSDSSNAYIGTVKQVSTTNKNNFNSTLTYIITSIDSSITKTYNITVITNKNTECNLLTYGFVNPSVSGSITQISTGGTVDLTVPYGTPLSNIVPYFTLSDSANAYISSVNQISNVTSNNFTSLVAYKIVAKDTNYHKTYYINIKFDKNKACNLLTYAIAPSITGTITPTGNTGGTVSVRVPFGTYLNSLIALFTVSDSGTVYINSVKQQTGVTVNNFTSPLSYKIVAQDTNYSKTYIVTVLSDSNSACDLIAYNIISPNATGMITANTAGGLVNIAVPFGTNVTNLISQFTISDSAKAFVNTTLQQSSITLNDYTDTLHLTIKAQNNINTKTYLVKVAINAGIYLLVNNEKIKIFPNPASEELSITNNQFQFQNKEYKIINILGQTIIIGKLTDIQTTIDISNLARGVYYFLSQSEEGFRSDRFVKN